MPKNKQKNRDKLQLVFVSKDPQLYKPISSLIKKISLSLHLFESPLNATNFYKEHHLGHKIIILDESIDNDKLKKLINDILVFNNEEQIILLASSPLDSILTNDTSSKIAYHVDRDYLISHPDRLPQIINHYIKKILTTKITQYERQKKDKVINKNLESLQIKNQELLASEETLKKKNHLLSHTEQHLKVANQQLLAVNKRLMENEKTLRKNNQDLKDRIIKLDFLYKLSELVDNKSLSIEDTFQNMAELISSAWDYPSIRRSIVSSLTEKINYIADRAEAKEKLSANEKKYRALAENVGDIIWAMDLSLQLTYISPSIKPLLGYTKEEAKTKTFDHFLTPSSFKQFSSMGYEELSHHKMTNQESNHRHSIKLDCELVHKDKTTTWNEIIITLMSDKENIPTGFLVVSRDITERKKAEDEAKFYNSLLRHNISNTNQIILGYLKLLSDTKLSKVQKEYLETTLQATQESNNVIQKVNKLEKIKSGYTISSVPLDTVLRKVINNYSHLSKEKGIDITYKPKKIMVMANQLLSDVFSNIIHNVLIHSQGNTLSITVSIEDDFCKISFIDDGKGIPDYLKETIFNRGIKGKESKGMGIGLYIVKKIIEGYHGKVEISNRSLNDYTPGTIFNIYIPKDGGNTVSLASDDEI